MRVLMVVPQYPFPVVGGLELQAHELSKALIRHGAHVEVLSGRVRAGQPPIENVEGVKVHRIHWSASKLVRFIRTPLDVFRALFRLRSGYDVVHLHQCSWFGLFVVLAARSLGKPVLTKLASVGEAGLEGMACSAFGSIKVAIFKQSDAVVAMSSISLAELKQIDYPLHRVLATTNGIFLGARVSACPVTVDATRSCRVVFVGRLAREKRIDDLLHVWHAVTATACRPMKLEIWGQGPLEASLRALSRTLGIEDSVEFCGHVAEVRARLEDVDVFVLPSNSEGNSNAVLEAMAAGLPIVATRVGGTPLLVGPAGDPHLFVPGDRAAMAARLSALIGDESLRRATGAAMYRRVSERFDIQVIASTYRAAYEKLAAGRREEVAELGTKLVLES